MFKKFIIISFITLLLISGCSKEENKNYDGIFKFNENDFKNVSKINSPWYDNYRVVYHALGEVNGFDYTNTYEALVNNYNKGSRVFETDFSYTSDNEIVLVHEWLQYHEEFNLGENTSWDKESLEYFVSHPIYDNLTPMTLLDLLEVMKHIPDFYIVMDSKTFDEKSCRDFYKDFINQVKKVDKNLLKRFIPQAYSEETYKVIKDLYNWEDIIFTCYAIYNDSDGTKIYEFVSENKIKNVVMHMDNDWAIKVIRDIYNLGNYGSWKNTDYNIYIHTINDIDKAKSIVIDEGFYGIYTDTISEDEFLKAIN